MELPVRTPIGINATLNVGVLLYALLVSLIAGVLFGLAPALQATRPDVVSMLKNDSERRARSRRLSMRSGLVVGQVAAAVVLLLVTGLFLRSLVARQNVDPGFGQKPTALLHVAFPPRYRGALGRQLMQRLEERVRTIPGVQAVGATDFLPLNPTEIQAGAVQVDGITPPRGEDGFTIDFADVDAGFFAAAGIPILRGRNFDDGLDREGGVRVAVINQVMAERYWPKRDPIGLTFRGDERLYTVIGIARNTKVRSLGEEPRPMYFTALSQTRSNYQTLVVRTGRDAERTLVQVMAAARQTDPDSVMIEATTTSRYLAVMLLPTRLAALACAAFAALALCLALIGVYGVVSYSVARRASEMGIRMALGALPGELVRLLMRDGMALVALGALGGVAVAAISARLLHTMLFGVQPIDPVTFSIAPVVLVCAACLQCGYQRGEFSAAAGARVEGWVAFLAILVGSSLGSVGFTPLPEMNVAHRQVEWRAGSSTRRGTSCRITPSCLLSRKTWPSRTLPKRRSTRVGASFPCSAFFFRTSSSSVLASPPSFNSTRPIGSWPPAGRLSADTWKISPLGLSPNRMRLASWRIAEAR
jgi:predicted permease